MSENGILLEADTPLTRGETAKLMYRLSAMKEEAPGTRVY
jgi:hypothetical protein